jgi:hypothetical protein
MAEYGTIKIPREEYNKHNERRQKRGMTWSQYIEDSSPDDRHDDLLDRLDELLDNPPEPHYKSACWDGYTMVGMTEGKNGEMVPNCIPDEEVEEALEYINGEIEDE